MSTAPEDEGIWLQLEYDREARCFVFVCSCGWEGDTANLYRAAVGIDAHLRACDGERPTRRDGHYRPENHPDARVSHLPKYPEVEGN